MRRKISLTPTPNVKFQNIRSTLIKLCSNYKVVMPVAERSKAWVCSQSPARIADSNPAGGMDVCLLWVLCVVR